MPRSKSALASHAPFALTRVDGHHDDGDREDGEDGAQGQDLCIRAAPFPGARAKQEGNER